MAFTGDQLLHGTHGEKEGIPAGVRNSIQYGYHIIDVCARVHSSFNSTMPVYFAVSWLMEQPLTYTVKFLVMERLLGC